MFRGPPRKVNPIKQQNPETVMRDHLVKNVNARNAFVQEYNVLTKERPTPFCMKDLNIPAWLLALLVSLTIIVFTAFIIFATVVTLKKETHGGACKSNSDCRQDRGLMCNNYRCGCAYSHFWTDTYQVCERRRMINRTCLNDTMCDALGNLQCQSVTLSGGGTQLQCQCQAGMEWILNSCESQQLYNGSCVRDANCDTTRYLYCNTLLGLCRCNSTMFWNGDSDSGTCEYKRTVSQYCKPYDDSWCDNTGPVGQGLVCAQYSNPYGDEYGVCQCSTYYFYNGSSSLGNGYCVPMRLYNQSCSSTSECDYRVGLTCSNNLCTCPSGTDYNGAVNSSGAVGYCQPAGTYLDNCTTASQCSSSQNLYCDLTYYSNANLTGVCNCYSGSYYWDGTTCASKLSIGGECSNNTQCKSSLGLFCSNYTNTVGTCDCTKYYYWNETCTLKIWYNQSCTSNYVCDDNRGLQCQGLGGSMFQKCDCFNNSYIWDSLYVTNQSYTCIVKKTYGVSTCYGDLECEDFNYLKCNNGTCGCDYVDYWDGSRCQPKRNYTEPCATTTECRDFSPVNLICRLGTTVPPALQCLCNTTSFWEECSQRCVTSKKRHEACTLVSNCTSNECDISANLQCINDSNTNITGSGWCNCTSLQWWNGTYCRNKGTPAWGSNASAVCNATFQCADYNLVSCPLGSSSVASLSTCECATTKYWSGTTCLDRVFFGQSCTLWHTYPVNTSTCLSAAGAGLYCQNTTCSSGVCTGSCLCPSGTTWNSTFSICASTSSG